MHETWLHPNRRAILLGCVPPLLLAAAGAWLASQRTWQWIGFAVVIVACAIILMLLVQLSRPRVAYADNHVLFYLRSGPPIAVPVDVVEAFFLGQGSAELPGMSQQPQTVNLVARLSQRRTEWARQEVKRALGQWCEGYVTIRGSWCERLDGELIRRLNRRLKEVKDAV
jgi:hypothetical protein